MAKSKMRKNNFLRKSMKNISAASAVVLPKVEKGLENVGSFVTTAAKKGAPLVEKGLSTTFKALKGVSNSAISRIKKTLRLRKNKTRRHRKSRRHH